MGHDNLRASSYHTLDTGRHLQRGSASGVDVAENNRRICAPDLDRLRSLLQLRKVLLVRIAVPNKRFVVIESLARSLSPADWLRCSHYTSSVFRRLGKASAHYVSGTQGCFLSFTSHCVCLSPSSVRPSPAQVCIVLVTLQLH